jgi:pimeloyl-ACP methyl ester carboxylesterase
MLMWPVDRGHGLSEKPEDAYGDSGLFADDVRAVIDTLELDHPILCCSYGVVICDYVRHHGESAGHAPYLEDHERFNRELRAFVLSVTGAAVPAW